MTRDQLAKQLDVSVWDLDDWLLAGCPAEKFLSRWNFDLAAVKRWLRENEIKVRKRAKAPSGKPRSDRGWLNNRCPKCMEKGFQGDRAGLLCTLGEVVMGRWNFRRVGFPCGHSIEILT